MDLGGGVFGFGVGDFGEGCGWGVGGCFGGFFGGSGGGPGVAAFVSSDGQGGWVDG